MSDDIHVLNMHMKRIESERTSADTLASMFKIEEAVQDVVSTTELRQKHIHHMTACQKVFDLHLEQMISRQTELIQLLQAQQHWQFGTSVFAQNELQTIADE